MGSMLEKNDNLKKAKDAFPALALAALGVVFGDIGTSPLYALRECFHGEYGLAVNQDNIFGVLSLMFWALIIIVSIKYLTFILHADNHGEGGVIALTALAKDSKLRSRKYFPILIGMGIFGACLLYGDGMITPAISVMSAAEGLRIITPGFQPFVIPATLIILACLFLFQHRGTARIGGLFGPIILIWFVVIACLGLRQLIQHPDILAALSPWYGIRFLLHGGIYGFTVLGAVFLVVTGAEALYADLGHFGKQPIRRVWFFLVLPALLLNYFGQGALLLAHPEESHHPFYATVPSWAIIPMVILATSATIIASQAVITGVFSLTRQAVQMGYLPRMRIIHTSLKHFGQIYVPQINWIMMLATLALVLGFQSSSKLAAAYGVAVTSTMLISTILFYAVARAKWGWGRFAAGVPVFIFLLVDISFFSANLSKIFHGAWFPLAIGAVFFFTMTTWKRGRELLMAQLQGLSVSFRSLKNQLSRDKVIRIRGHAIYMTGRSDIVPIALSHNIRHNKVLHSQVAFLNFALLEIPRVPNKDKLVIEDLGSGFHMVSVYYGFMESPSIPIALSLAAGQGLDFPINETSFFLGRERLIFDAENGMHKFRSHLFALLSRNAYDASLFFDIPQEQVIEVGIRLRI